MAHANIKRIATHIVANPSHYSHTIGDTMSAFTHGDYHHAGHALEHLCILLFHGHHILTMDTYAFITGFLEGISESGNPQHLERCLVGIKHILHYIHSALSHIKSMNHDRVIRGIREIMSAFSELHSKLHP